jgi:hypothetical protein
MSFFWTSEGGNSFREYFKNKPGNLFSNFDILLGTSQRTIYMKFKKFFLAHSVLLYLKRADQILPEVYGTTLIGFLQS